MRSSFLDWLCDPEAHEPFRLDVFESEGDEIVAGVLAHGDRWYPIIDAVPRVLTGEVRGDYRDFASRWQLEASAAEHLDPSRRAAGLEQAATNVTFSSKWTRFKQYGLEPDQRRFLNAWYVKKLGLESTDDLAAFYAGKSSILEIGPGSGFNTRFMAEHTRGTVVSVDISAAAVTTHENTRELENCHVVQADLMNLPCRDGTFEFVIADGVLHHTPDTRAAMEALYRKVAPGGQFFFYVYRRMGPARAFCDRHIRALLSRLDPESCSEACEGFTELGRELSRIGARIKLEKGIPVLGIPPGEHDVQRLLYYHFLKCFWNDAFDWDTNNMVNFDWYHPHHAWQHTDEEIDAWLQALGVTDYTFHPANPNGISVLLTKPA